MAKAADIRISNAERDEAVSALGEHMATGRLTIAEYEERCGRAAAASTRGELEALFADLPAPHPDLSSATPPATLVRKAGQLVANPKQQADKRRETPASKALETIAGLSMLIGIPGAILLTIFAGLWWVFIPVGLTAIVAGAASEAAKQPRGTN
jgi:hypothetical protein